MNAERPVGPLVDAHPAKLPQRTVLEGRAIKLVPLDANAHGDDLFEAVDGHDQVWTYLADGPFATREAFKASLSAKAQSTDPLFFAIVDKQTGRAVGYQTFLRIDAANRVIEVGNIVYSPRLQRTVGATEAQHLFARYAFEDLGYRRYEWKCNALNAPSRRAAERYGFTFEGVFRQHMIVKGRNRDTAWFSMLDSEWPARRAAFEAWLDPLNFDAAGLQIKPLAALRAQFDLTRPV